MPGSTGNTFGLKRRCETMPAVIKYRHITRDEEVQGGEPVLKGTRFPVRSVIHYVVREGKHPKELVEMFPHLREVAVYEALLYYEENKEEVEELLQKHREEAWKK